jgi:hypothetical protein
MIRTNLPFVTPPYRPDQVIAEGSLFIAVVVPGHLTDPNGKKYPGGWNVQIYKRNTVASVVTLYCEETGIWEQAKAIRLAKSEFSSLTGIAV